MATEEELKQVEEAEETVEEELDEEEASKE
jgi:hypothetical protein